MAMMPTKESVYGGSPIPTSSRKIVSYDSSVVSNANINAARTLSNVGESVKATGKELYAADERAKKEAEIELRRAKAEAEKAAGKQDALTRARMESDLLERKAALEHKFANSNDYENYSKEATSQLGGVWETYKDKFNSPVAQAVAETSFGKSYYSSLGKVDALVVKQHNKTTQLDSTNRLNENLRLLSFSKDPEEQQDLIEVGNAIIRNGYTGLLAGDVVKIQQDYTERASQSLLLNGDVTKNISLVNKALEGNGVVAVNKNATTNYILGSEGDGVVVEPNGGYSQWGITTKNHPELAEKIEKGELTKEEAASVMEKEYWSRVSSIPENMQPLAVDFLFNGWDKKVLGISYKEAILNADGDIDKALDTRLKYYDALYKSNPEKYGSSILGWKSRVTNLRRFMDKGSVTGSPTDHLTKPQLEAVEKELLGKMRDDIDKMSVNELNSAKIDGSFDSLNATQRKQMLAYSVKALKIKSEELEVSKLAVGANKVSDLQIASEDGTITQQMISAAKVKFKDDANALTAIDSIEKLNFGKLLENKEKVLAGKNIFDYNVDINLQYDTLGLGEDLEKKKAGKEPFVNLGKQETVTDLVKVRNKIYEGMEVGLIKDSEKVRQKFINIAKAIDSVVNAERWWGLETKELAALRSDPFFSSITDLKASFFEKNPSFAGNKAFAAKAYSAMLNSFSSLPEGLTKEQKTKVALTRTMVESFPELAGVEEMPSTLHLADGRIVNMPVSVVGKKAKVSDYIRKTKLKDSYILKDGSKISGEALERMAAERNVSGDAFVDYLRETKELKDGE